VFAPLKAAYRDEAKRILRGGVNIVGKQYFTSLYSLVREKAFTKKNIMAAWAACGLFPFNPDRVLSVIPKPPAQLDARSADKTMTDLSSQDVPQTPVIPVLAEDVTSLYNLIKQGVNTADGLNSRRLERHVRKLADAAQISITERALLHDQNQTLIRMNNEAKARRSTRSVVLGKAKVMSFEDIEVARAARAAKEVAKGKGKRGRKRKSAALETDGQDPESVLACAAQDADEAEPEAAPMFEGQRAPVAYMG
jgi:hypothetical protein